jgi:hypothetical protein
VGEGDLGPSREVFKLEDAQWPIPHDGASARDDFAEDVSALWPAVEARETVGNPARLVVRCPDGRVFSKLVRSHVINGKVQFDTLGLGFVHQTLPEANKIRLVDGGKDDKGKPAAYLDDVRASLVKEGAANVDTIDDFLECVRHSAADDHGVHLKTHNNSQQARKKEKNNQGHTLSRRLLISWILSLTFAPPKMDKKGRSGFSKALAK